jgi:hypothetical protein
MARFRRGEEDCCVGGHPMWLILRDVFQIRSNPLVLGGLCLNFEAMVCRVPRLLSVELVACHRAEQLRCLRNMAVGRLEEL